MAKDTFEGLSTIRQIAITVRDVARAKGFYRDVLGMKFLFDAPGDMTFFDCGGIRLLIGLSPRPELDPPGSVLYYRVGDIHAAYETLSARGTRFEGSPRMVARMPDHELWIAEFRDPDGNVLALMSEVRAD